MARRSESKTTSRTTRSKGGAGSLNAQTRVCVLHGPDAARRKGYIDQLQQALEADRGEIHRIDLDGKSADAAAVFDELRSFSLLEQYKLVVVGEAEPFVTTYRKIMERYVTDPVDHATLVLCCGRWHKGKLDKLIDGVGCLLKCEPVTVAEARDWLVDRASTVHGRPMARPAASVLVDRMGTDLVRLDQELAKIALMGDLSKPIDAGLVAEVAGQSSDEDAWAIQEEILKSIGSGGDAASRVVGKVHGLVHDAKRPEILINYFVTDLMRKLQAGAALRREGASPPQIASELKLWGARAGVFHRALDRVDAAAASRLLDRAIDGDLRTKVGLSTPLRNLEMFCCVLAGEVRDERD